VIIAGLAIDSSYLGFFEVPLRWRLWCMELLASVILMQKEPDS
jgi:hypothetical protein